MSHTFFKAVIQPNNTKMQRFLIRPIPLIVNPFAALTVGRFATASHPNSGNFANRPKEQLSEAGRKGGKKGGKAHGVGGFHNMDPEKQVCFF